APGRLPFGEPAGCSEALVVHGFAVAAAGTVPGPGINDVVAAEAVLRIRERFAKQYGVPIRTVGVGDGAAGSALARIAARSPGLDALVATDDAATDQVADAVAQH